MSKVKPADAERVAGLAGILQQSNQQKDNTPPALPEPAPDRSTVASPATPQATPRRSKAKPLAKRNDPDWHHFGIYLRKKTHKRAKRLMEDTQPEWDMSDLVEHLLQQYIASK